MTQENTLPDHAPNYAIERRTAASGRASARRRRTYNFRSLVIAALLIAGLLGLALYAILLRTLETTTPLDAASLQEQNGEIYGPATDGLTFAYKLERYRLRRPDILLVGSRRIASFVGEAFIAPMLNASGVAETLDEMTAFVHAAVAIHRPKSILIGLDFWWFSPNQPTKHDDIATSRIGSGLMLMRLMEPVQWVLHGRTSVSGILRNVMPFGKNTPGIGALAKIEGQGWDVFGRFDYGRSIDGERNGGDRHFGHSLALVRGAAGSGALDVRVAPSTEALRQLASLIAELESLSIEVVLLVPPVAGPVRATIAQDAENRLVPLWRDAINSLGVRVFDFEDATVLGSSDCEFVDGFHGGEVTYLRILDAISNFGGTFLSNAIDQDMVTGLIATNAGHVRLVELRPAGVPAEIDFLDLGCNKRH